MNAPQHWLDAEVEYIRAFPHLSDAVIAAKLTALTGIPRTWKAVYRKRQKMGFYKQGRGPLPSGDPNPSE